MTSSNASRRLFLRQAGALSLLGSSAAPLALNLAAIGSAAAMSSGDYKALVCVFLTGGNDAYNTVLATDPASWRNYTAVRDQAPDSIALQAPGVAPNPGAVAGSPARLGGVLPISPTNAQGRSFALHPQLGLLQAMFDNDRRLAIVANVGPLVVPTTKTQYDNIRHPLPAKLFSHNDQMSNWQSFASEGSTRGWGGRMADLLASMNSNATFSAISAGGNAVWLSGQTIRQYQVNTNGAILYGVDTGGSLYGSHDIGAALQRIARQPTTSHVFEKDYAALTQRSMDAELVLRNALQPGGRAPWGTPMQGTYDAKADPKLQYVSPISGRATPSLLARQLQVVARMIDASGAPGVGARRQVFFVQIGAFDTHNSQNAVHAEQMAMLAHGLRYFDTTLGQLGARDKVTTFTASDFGRSFTSNGNGTDHGWGGHHFVMGGAVRGGDIYGRFPVLAAKNRNDNEFDGSADQLLNGVLLPQVSVDQYGATLARWFGVSDSQLGDVFPNLANFGTRNLGFID